MATEQKDAWEAALAEATAVGAGVRMDVYAVATQFVTDPTVAVGQVDMNVIQAKGDGTAAEEAERRYPIEHASTPGGATLVYAKQRAFVEGAQWAKEARQ